MYKLNQTKFFRVTSCATPSSPASHLSTAPVLSRLPRLQLIVVNCSCQLQLSIALDFRQPAEPKPRYQR